ncbi:hypothetical protein FRC14_005864 [Serendipita sp. 396]|nr:hypothetical protein FRC14_005864 [Serendipita sp. 396]
MDDDRPLLPPFPSIPAAAASTPAGGPYLRPFGNGAPKWGAMAIMIKAGNAIPPKRSLPTSNSTSYLLMDLSIELSRTPSWPQAARSETDHGIQLCFVLAYIPFLR